MPIPPLIFLVWWCLVGLVVGSFLNVVIHRWGLEGESVSRPRRSRCPSCRHELTWRENVPVVSWVLLRGRCRWCGWRIRWRYPLVEVLTAGLFGLAAALSPGEIALVVVQSVVLAGLVVATFVDFDHFEIPDQVSIGGMVLAPIASLFVPALHRETWLALQLSGGAVDRTGALIASLAGLAVGGGALLLMGVLGKALFGRDAMGLGDVKLLAAGGGFVGPGGALVALLLGSLVASVFGVANLVRFTVLSRRRARVRGGRKPLGRSFASARILARYLPFGPYLGIGVGITLLAWNHVAELLREFLSLPR